MGGINPKYQESTSFSKIKLIEWLFYYVSFTVSIKELSDC